MVHAHRNGTPAAQGVVVVAAGRSGEFDAGDAAIESGDGGFGFEAGDVLTDALMDAHAEADVSGWSRTRPKGCGSGCSGVAQWRGSWLAAPRRPGSSTAPLAALLVATSSRGEVIGVDPVELLAELGDLGLVGVGDSGVECEGRRPDEVEQFVGGADRSTRL